MKVSFWCCSFTKVSYSYSIFAIYSIIITSSWCLWKLRTQRRWNCANIHLFTSIMNRHLLSFTKIFKVSCELMSHLLNSITSPQESSWFSILRKKHIILLNSCSCSYAWSFFSWLCHIKAYSTLTLCLIEYLISFINDYHFFKHLNKFNLRNQFFMTILVDYIPFFIHYSETFYLIKLTFEIHFICKFMLK